MEDSRFTSFWVQSTLLAQHFAKEGPTTLEHFAKEGPTALVECNEKKMFEAKLKEMN